MNDQKDFYAQQFIEFLYQSSKRLLQCTIGMQECLVIDKIDYGYNFFSLESGHSVDIYLEVHVNSENYLVWLFDLSHDGSNWTVGRDLEINGETTLEEFDIITFHSIDDFFNDYEKLLDELFSFANVEQVKNYIKDHNLAE